MGKVVIIAVSLLILLGAGFLIFKYYSPLPTENNSTSDTSNAVMVKNDPVKGDYLADSNGKPLYTYDGDTPEKSNCNNDCTKTWSPYSKDAKPAPTESTETSATTKTKNINNVYMPEEKVKVPESNVNVREAHIDVRQTKIKPTKTPVEPVKVMKRNDGTSQYSYKGHALYHFSGDKKPTDINGDTVDKSWHLAKP